MGCEKGATSHLLAWHGGKRKPRLSHSHWGEIPKLWISIRKEVKLLGLGVQMNKKSNKKNRGRCHWGTPLISLWRLRQVDLCEFYRVNSRPTSAT